MLTAIIIAYFIIGIILGTSLDLEIGEFDLPLAPETFDSDFFVRDIVGLAWGMVLVSYITELFSAYVHKITGSRLWVYVAWVVILAIIIYL